MSVLFFRCEPVAAPFPALPLGVALRIWQPARDGPPPLPWSRSNLVWWLMDQLGLFARRDFAEITLWRDDHMLHRLILTPRWYRFPFMEWQDLQIGDVWTDPAVRGQGLALLGVSLALALAGRMGAPVWYVTVAEHQASAALARRAGLMPAGHGHRSRPFSLRAVGRYWRAGPPVPPPPR
jgi:RimJ/RimL family protein N-acetyltransferase